MGIEDSGRSGIDGITLTLAIAIGVAVGTVVGGLALWKIAEHQMAAAARDVSQQAQQMQRALTAREAAEREARERAARAAALAEEERVRALAAAQRADAAARTDAAEQVERREQAWRKFYRPSPGCGAAATSVECSNEFIRAKRAFDDKFARGEL